MLAAALLHDTVEDTQTTANELAGEFGREIAATVMEVTDDKTLPKEERKRLQIEHAPQLSRGAKLVELADKVCNLRDIIAAAPPAGWSLERKRVFRLGETHNRRHAGYQRPTRNALRRRIGVTALKKLLSAR